jgi:hypothetical protein
MEEMQRPVVGLRGARNRIINSLRVRWASDNESDNGVRGCQEGVAPPIVI